MEAEELLAIARTATAEDPVCAACIGRLVADRSFGLANEARGNALRIVADLAADEPHEPPAATECWVCEGHSARVDEWAARAVECLDGIEFATYMVGCRVPPLLEENDRLLRELCGLEPDAGEPLKAELNREVGKLVGKTTDTIVDFDRPDVVVLLHLERGTVEREINPAFVYGRYQKRERDIPQTEWPCTDCGATGKQFGPDGEEPCAGCDGTGYRYDRSVEGLTVPQVVEAMKGTEGVFHGAGREDVDARMLGTGRPFVIEVKSPSRRTPDLATLEWHMNEAADGAVVVSELAYASHEMVERVKELPASKRYRMDVEFDAPVDEPAFASALDQLAAATIEQRTPNRVDHRRADRVRTRAVYEATGSLESPTTATIEVHTAGGLYVKELVSGDAGRTEPSLAGVLDIPATVTALDVVAVEGETEPFDDPAYLLAE